MTSGYEQTIRVLSKSNNRAASELLKLAMNSSHEGVRKSACAEVVSARGPKVVLEYLQNLDSLDEITREVLTAHPNKLVSPIRTAFISNNLTLQRNAVRATLMFKVYDLIPGLLFMVGDRSESGVKTEVPIAELLVRLTKQFVEDIEANEVSDAFLGFVLHETKQTLQRQITSFRRSDDPSCIKVFLLLGPYIQDKVFNAAELFRNPMHPVYTALAGVVQTESDEYVFRFILNSLEAAKVPGLILAAISNRTDLPFLEYLFENMDSPPSSNFQANIARVHRFDWIASLRTLLPQLTEKAQQSLLELIHFSELPKEEIYAVSRQVYQFGKSAGRCAALVEIANYRLEESETIIREALDDEDPYVQAAALRQIRKLNSSQGMMSLISKIDSPHKVVREAVKMMLPEFQVRRFLDSFEQLSEEQRKKTLNIIRKIDPSLPNILAEEVQVGNPTMKVRALKSIELGGLTGLVEEPLCAVLLREEAAVLRVKAASLLADGKREISRLSLLQATHKDTSLDVRLTAKASLEMRNKNKELDTKKQP